VSARSDVAIDIQALGTAMIEAARKAIAGRRAQKAVIEIELRRLAGALADTGGLLARGEIDRERAEAMVAIYRLAVSGILQSAKGMTLLATDLALSAAMQVAGAAINRVTGFKLIQPERKNP
jgi:hypothetical protein